MQAHFADIERLHHQLTSIFCILEREFLEIASGKEAQAEETPKISSWLLRRSQLKSFASEPWLLAVSLNSSSSVLQGLQRSSVTGERELKPETSTISTTNLPDPSKLLIKVHAPQDESALKVVVETNDQVNPRRKQSLSGTIALGSFVDSMVAWIVALLPVFREYYKRP